MMPGRAQHPSVAMRRVGHIVALKEGIARLEREIVDREKMIQSCRKVLVGMEKAAKAQGARHG